MIDRRWGFLLCGLLLAAGCDDGGTAAVPDVDAAVSLDGTVDEGAAIDVGPDDPDPDAGTPDAAEPEPEPDAAVPPDAALPPDAAEPECMAGTEDCECGLNDFCNIGLECVDGTCRVPCPAGTDTCPCDDEGACEDDLYCDPDDETCRPPVDCDELECAEHQLCDVPEDEGPTCLEECEQGFVWNAEAEQCDELIPPSCAELDCGSQGRVCDDGPEPACGDCVEGLIADDDACRAPVACVELDCAAQNRACAADEGQDAACGACVEGFQEVDGFCVDPGCEALGCAALNRACVAGDAACGACLDGFEEQEGACIAPPAGCDALGCAAQNRACVADPEPACGGCLDGFADQDGACVPPPAATCVADAPGSIAADCAESDRTCLEDGAGARCGDCLAGLVDAEGVCVSPVTCEDLPCSALGRTCAGAPFAECGDCAAGTRPVDADDPASACAAPLTCGDIACANGEFCLEGVGLQDAECSPSPCADGEAFRTDRNVCVACDLICGEVGETGRVWPFTLAFSDDCLCETESGYYADVAGAIRALECDADGDGWVRLSARASLESDDEAIRDNARCQLREIDSVTLQNDLGQRHVLRSCEEGWAEPDAPVCALRPIGLYETVRNDDAVQLERDGDVSAYAAGGVGRPLRPAELNSLTKACVSTRADHNHNGLADVAEHHDVEPPVDLDPALRPFLELGYFLELHRGYYEAPAEEDGYGTFVIAERSRCADGFSLGYADGEGEYWRSCMRNRDAGYGSDPALFTPVGYDFARFACDDANGTCETPPPVTGDGALDEPVPHDTCTLPTPEDGIWRGMGHHSQFRCVVVTNAADLAEPRGLAPQQVTADALYNGVQGTRTWQFNACGVACPADDPDCAGDCDGDGCATSTVAPGGLSNPSHPVIDCAPALQDEEDANFAAGTVGFVSSRYVDVDNTYVRGCINEWASGRGDAAWKNLCPGYADNPDGVVGDGNGGDFGRLLCGCGFAYGGAECDLGCPALGIDSDGDGALDTDVGGLHYGGDVDDPLCDAGYCPNDPQSLDGGRRGYWMCGAFSVTSLHDTANRYPHAMRRGDWVQRGTVSRTGFTGRSCEGDDCSQGWGVRPANIADLDR